MSRATLGTASSRRHCAAGLVLLRLTSAASLARIAATLVSAPLFRSG